MISNIEETLRTVLKDKGMGTALSLMDVVKTVHTSFRKDGVTPYTHHLFDVALKSCRLPGPLENREAIVCLGLLHDMPEDYPEYMDAQKFGATIENSFHGDTMKAKLPHIIENAYLLSKKNRDGTDKGKQPYFDEMKGNPMCILVKGCDGLSNLLDTPSSKDVKFIRYYINYTQKYHIPLLETLETQAAHYLINQFGLARQVVNFMANSFELSD